MVVVLAAFKSLIWVHDPTAAGGSVFVCAVTKTTWKSTSHVPVDFKEQGSYFYSNIDEYRDTIVKEGHRKLK